MGKTSVPKALKMLLSVPNIQPTRTQEEVSLVFREPCILSGFRLPYKSWTYYILSLFQIHNEIVNIWSHIVACLLYLYLTFLYGVELDSVNNPKTWGIISFGIGCAFYAFASALAHTFHSKSETIHYRCFQIDYIGIGMYGQAMGTMLFYSSGTKEFYQTFGHIYVPVNTFFSILVCICSSQVKMIFTRPYPPHRKLVQMGSTAAQIAFFFTPLYYRIYNKFIGYDDGTASLYPHLIYCAWFVVSIAFFASHFPERLMPGMFDIVGHGHQLFHILITYTTLKQMEAGYLDLINSSREEIEPPIPSAYLTFGGLLFVLVVDIVYIFSIHSQVKESVKRDLRLQKQQEKEKRAKIN